MILLGLLALLFPFGIGKLTMFVIGLFLLAGGFLRLMFAVSSPSLGSLFLRYLFGIFMIVAGLWLIFKPSSGLAAFTFILALYFLLDGFSSLAYGVSLFPVGGGMFMFLNGLLSVLFALLIWFHWPQSSQFVL